LKLWKNRRIYFDVEFIFYQSALKKLSQDEKDIRSSQTWNNWKRREYNLEIEIDYE
jgi:hypothetical protein